jgi:hypothetical protein
MQGRESTDSPADQAIFDLGRVDGSVGNRLDRGR